MKERRYPEPYGRHVARGLSDRSRYDAWAAIDQMAIQAPGDKP